MITEDYVSFETAKLLKEKGFDEECYTYYNKVGNLVEENYKFNWNFQTINYSAPTQQMAIKWLRKLYDIDVSIVPLRSHKEYLPRVESFVISHDCISCKKYEDACDSAILYCLKNLM